MTSGGQLPPPQPPGPWGGGQFPPSPPPPPAYPTPYNAGPPHAGPAPGLGYAGFWIRFVALLIDDIILGVPLVVIFFATEGSSITSYRDCIQTGTLMTLCNSMYLGSLLTFELLAVAVSFFYSVILWSTLGGTLGQRSLGLHVVDAGTGKHIGIGRAIGRYVGFVISAAVVYIGLIWVAFDPRKQGWHDKMASTFVVRKV